MSTKPPIQLEPKPSTPPADYQPKRGGAHQTWNPTVNVRICMSAADAAYYKARMDEQLASGEEDKR